MVDDRKQETKMIYATIAIAHSVSVNKKLFGYTSSIIVDDEGQVLLYSALVVYMVDSA